MPADKESVKKNLTYWKDFLADYRLPKWEEIPDIGLYMEQVLVMLQHYLDYLPPELKEEQFITAATINNYVNKKFMPKPYKKRYYRIHIAYMIMICTLKHSMSISMLQRLIPNNISEDEVKRIYNSYAKRHKAATEYFIEQVQMIAGPLLYDEDPAHKIAVDATEDLITESAVISALSGLLAEKLLLLGESNGDV